MKNYYFYNLSDAVKKYTDFTEMDILVMASKNNDIKLYISIKDIDALYVVDRETIIEGDNLTITKNGQENIKDRCPKDTCLIEKSKKMILRNETIINLLEENEVEESFFSAVGFKAKNNEWIFKSPSDFLMDEELTLYKKIAFSMYSIDDRPNIYQVNNYCKDMFGYKKPKKITISREKIYIDNFDLEAIGNKDNNFENVESNIKSKALIEAREIINKFKAAVVKKARKNGNLRAFTEEEWPGTKFQFTALLQAWANKNNYRRQMSKSIATIEDYKRGIIKLSPGVKNTECDLYEKIFPEYNEEYYNMLGRLKKKKSL